MKLLIATGLYPPDIGGPATYTVFLEKHLPRFGIEFSVVAYAAVRNYPKILRHVMYLFALIRASRGCEIILALDTISVGVPALLASIITRKKLYLRVPGDYAWEQGQQRYGISETLDEYLDSQVKQPTPIRILAWFQYCVAKHATTIIVPSEYMKTVVSRWGIDTKKVTRIYSILKVIDVPESRNELRTLFDYRGFVVITAARLVPWKGIGTLIDVIASLRTEGFDMSLIVVGVGTSRADLEHRAHEQHIASHVHFCGVLDRSVLGKRIKGADAFVLNTSYEGLSHQLIEVMHIGIPIVTTPVGGNVELITHGTEGLLVPYDNREEIGSALKDLYHNERIRSALVENAREKVKLFHEDIIIHETVELLQSSTQESQL